ncbi:hypothetical protein TpMuguga_04g00375 [Theileria parva strain Muguga]|uniref:Uncharacterized protein n=1 Tax=Theileria parva TaxID=5875 RepID=Q4N2H4_THEPA|nr:uncharacterized protein TpMuguga_04g00375 [Theileria parva strain Muguga]EAN31727.1 hypothetical protein TpMuguga_04g00375 [Theileria parva strain Muguga]|eukprot:XP_764010.1 hypothetical protein [Theileria parva strain Muguga]
MDLSHRAPLLSESIPDADVLEDVVSSFGHSLDIVLKTNFKPAKTSDSNPASSSESLTSDSSSTKNQKLAAIFSRQWLSGVLATLSEKLSEDSHGTDRTDPIPVPSEPQFVDDDMDIQNIDDLGVYVENAKVCGNGQIEVNYDLLESESVSQTRPKLKAQQLMQLILQGKNTEWSLQKKLEYFWKTSPGLLLHLLSNEESSETVKDFDNVVNEEKHETVSVDEESMEFLNNLFNKHGQDDVGDLEEYLVNNPKVLVDEANKLGLVGVDRLVELFNKLKKEVVHVNKMSKFFTKLVLDLETNHTNSST